MAITHHIEDDHVEIVIDGHFSTEELFDGFEELLTAVGKKASSSDGE